MIRFNLISVFLVFFSAGAFSGNASEHAVRCSGQRPEMCSLQFDPVCGLSHGVKTTYPSACVACSDIDVLSYSAGPCEGETVAHSPHEILDSTPIVGTSKNDEQQDTAGFDQIWGGSGADTFVLSHMSSVPNQIMDFNPREGDLIKLSFLDRRSKSLVKKGNVSVDRKGVVVLTLLDGEVMPLVNINRTDLSASLNQRKGTFELTSRARF